MTCFFVSDLHGYESRYLSLFGKILEERPDALFMGGDILPSALTANTLLDPRHKDFINDFLAVEFMKLHECLGEDYPRVFLILGNDDGRFVEAAVYDAVARGIWEYVHDRKVGFGGFSVFGYAYIPPSPFQLKDWERYDVSRYVDPGCISPEEGSLSVPMAAYERKHATIARDLERLAGGEELGRSIFLFHSPPYKSKLDRAALDDKMIDYVPMDVHVGSMAIKKFITSRQPLLTLHGHVHESARLTGTWKDKIGQTIALSAAHDGDELALIRFDPESPENATRELILP